MGKPYVINITDGAGTKGILNDTYSVAAAVTGYTNASILPVSQPVTSGTNTYTFTIAAAGKLTLHVTENGSDTGTPVVGATFYRCDSGGTTYGSAAVTDANGDADLDLVPYAATGAPNVYYKQTVSDGDHEFSPALITTTLTASTKTVQVTNAPPATRTIYLRDVNYANLPVEAGTITLS